MTPTPARRRRLLAAAATVLLAATFGPAYPAGGAAAAPGADRQPSSGTPARSPDSHAGSTQVLLVSGDRVTYTTMTDGTAAVTVDPAQRPDGTPVAFQTVESADGYYVIPTDAYPLLADGTLDEQLFNVTTLVTDGLTTADRVPVIVTGAPGTARALASADSPVVAGRSTTLESIDGVGTTLGRSGATALWSQLTGADAAPGPATLAAGETRIWLDRAVQVSLDESVPQMGAPQVWDAGYDGSGVTVAVLDTGVDADHPDLSGRIMDTANFTPDPDRDGHGHGTHVAATVAGSGAASDGAYRGVAPGAALLIGKVLPDSGTGPVSAVIDGMEWAAHAGADVVNISVGGPITDGTDPASLAVDALTEQTGALFVIAAGNQQGDASVTSPGAASSALTVGAVDKQDALAWFSNRGPRHGDAAVKPELTAPGAAIVAARASGTTMGVPVDEHYTSADGTSMAAPHVAGAAALLAQAHPDWSWSQLKDALVSTSTSGDYRVFEGGAGRLDVAAAVTSGVSGPAAANAGALPAPYDEQRTLDLIYRNHTDRDVSLDLALAGESWHGQDLPAGAVDLGADTVTVPAGGTASVALTVDAGPGDPGAYTGLVTATAGELVLRTPVSYYKSVGSNRLTATNLDFRGQPQSGQAIRAVKLDGALPNDPFHREEVWNWSDDDGRVELAVADGLYDVYGSDVSYWDTHGDRITLTVASEVAVTSDTEVVLDGRQGVEVGPELTERTDLKSASVTYHREFDDGDFRNGFMVGYDPIRFFVQPAEPTVGEMAVQEQWSLAEPLVTTAEVRSAGRTVPLSPEYHNYFAGPVLAGAHDLPLVDAGTGSAEELVGAQVAGKAVLIGIPVPADDPNPYTAVWQAANDATEQAADQGAAAVLIFIDEPGAQAVFSLRSEEIPQLSVPWQEGIRVRATVRGATRTPARLVVHAHADPTDLYHLRYVHDDPALPAPRWQLGPDELVTVESRYHADEPGWTQDMVALAFLPGQEIAAGLNHSARTPLVVDEHIQAGDHLRWHRVATQRGTGNSFQPTALVSREVFLPGDDREPELWFQSPMRTGAADLPRQTQWTDLMCSFCRQGDMFRPGVWYLDSDPRHFERSLFQEGTSYRLFAGDEEIPNSGGAAVPAFALHPGPATYRLEMTGLQPGVPEARTLAPRVDTMWTFRSRRPDPDARPVGYRCPFTDDTGCAFQPLLQLDHQLNLDLLNRAPAGQSHTFEVGVAPHSGADQHPPRPVTTFTVWYSTDAGESWRPARVRPDRGRHRFEVTVVHPALADTDGYVWLRTEARDTAGNRVEQTIQRAYGLR